jgi:hypothetical protein
VAQKGLEWHQCRYYQWSRKLLSKNEDSKLVTQTSSAARELFRHARLQLRILLCLSAASLVNAIRSFFMRRSTNDARGGFEDTW